MGADSCTSFTDLFSAFFAMTETALIATNKHRLRHLAKRGRKSANTTLWPLERTDKLLSLTLIVSTLVHALATALVTAIAINTFGNHQRVITIATAAVAFLLIVFAEITPKVIGATYTEHIALPISFGLKPLMAITKPLIWFVNLVVSEILKILHIKTGEHAQEQRVLPEATTLDRAKRRQFYAAK